MKPLHTTKFSITRSFAVTVNESGWLVVTREALPTHSSPIFSFRQLVLYDMDGLPQAI